MALRITGEIAAMAAQAWNALGRTLRAIDRALSPRGIGVRGLRANLRGAVVIPFGRSGTRAWFVGRHASMPAPRPRGLESHHGVLDAWMRANFDKYCTGDAPAMLMPGKAHNATRSLYNGWRAEVARRQGVSIRDINWRRVSAGEIWCLAENSFDAAGAPIAARQRYWSAFNSYLESLE